MSGRAALVLAGLMSLVCATTAAAGSVVIMPGQFAPANETQRYKLYGIGEGVEWVPGEGSVWIAGVDLPPRAQITSLIVYCLDNVDANAVVRLFKTSGDGSPPIEIEVVVTGGTRSEPGTGFMANEVQRTEGRVDRSIYHYYVQAVLPPRPDDVRGILRITGVEVTYEK